jgi:hypothetical protein
VTQPASWWPWTPHWSGIHGHDRRQMRPETLIEGILKLCEKIEKQGLRLRGEA